jgi:branched-chain amino acid transport system substrate-binding protein
MHDAGGRGQQAWGWTAVWRLVLHTPLLLALLLFWPTEVAARRVALVIGNAGCAQKPLRNPLNDAADMSAALRAAGFEVLERHNRQADDLRRDLADFQDNLGPGTTALFYFAGHGMQAGRGLNYLLPDGVDYRRERDVELYGLEVGSVLRRMEESGASLSVVILDACRDSPLPPEGRSTAGRGLARMDAPSGSLLAFATAPGHIADDNSSGLNGLYTRHLLEALRTPGLRLEDVFKRVRRNVERDSGRRQSPEEISKLTSDEPFFFVSASAPVPTPAPRPLPPPPSPPPVGPELVVRIGHVGPSSGVIAHLGKDNAFGALLAVEDLNARRLTIGGQRVRFELVFKDDAADPKAAVSVARELVDARVSGVVGHLNSGTSIPAAAVYAAAGIPQISPSASNPRFTRLGFSTTFRLVIDDLLLGGAQAEFAVRQLGVRTVAVVDDRTVYGQGIADAFEQRAKALGLRVTAREFTNDKATSFAAQVARIKEGGPPDLVFYGGMDTTAGPLFRQMRQAGLASKLMGGDGICSGELPRMAQVEMTSGQVVCAEAGGVERSRSEGLQRFQERFKRRFNVDVQVYAPHTYDAVMMLADAMDRAGSADPERHLDALRKTNMVGITGPIAFDARGDLRTGAFSTYTYQGSRRELLGVTRLSP